jgi:catecholate siderophore receptor
VVTVPTNHPTTSLPIDLRPSATDANNHSVAIGAAAYIQDQIEVTRQVHAIVGLRYDRFDVTLDDHRTATTFTSTDGLASPRLGLVYKPVAMMSVYGSYSLSYLPRAGEQLSSLSATNRALDPEEFRNYEVGAKWDVAPALSLTTAVYRLNRGNVAIIDPLDPTISHLVDAQRTSGVEVEATGQVLPRWSVAGGYAYQDGEITRSLSTTVLAGAHLGQVPAHSLSLWNKVDLAQAWSVGFGAITRSDSLVATDNLVTLPGFVRVDTALYYAPASRLRIQVNVENLLNATYYPTANGNNNIMPGAPRAASITLVTKF